MKNRFEETFFSRAERHSLGVDRKVDKHFLAIPVSSGVVACNEQYALTPEQYRLLSTDLAAAAQFVDECRRREHDDQLIYQPGTNRGTPV